MNSFRYTTILIVSLVLVNVTDVFPFGVAGSNVESLHTQIQASAKPIHVGAKPIPGGAAQIQVGAAQTELYLPKLRHKRVGLIVNQTSMVGQTHLVDLLIENEINVVKLFAPEHGIRGDHDAGEKVAAGVDSRTGLPIVSLYGQTKRPTAKMLRDVDVLVFDIQDVGVRFYTYINTMFYSMQAAKAHGKEFIILDRPNPHIQTVDGPMLDEQFRSFVGLLPIPMVHGLTVGELGQLIVGEQWLETIEPVGLKQSSQPLKLSVVSIKNYDRKTRYQLPIAPSPNLPNQTAVLLYPSLCLFEATPVSIGRGTEWPFQVVGHDKTYIGNFKFSPKSIPGKSKHPKLEGKQLTGHQLQGVWLDDLNQIELSYILDWHSLFSKNNQAFFTRADFFDKLAGTDLLRKEITAGKTESQIRQSWQADLNKFKRLRQPYLLYD